MTEMDLHFKMEVLCHPFKDRDIVPLPLPFLSVSVYFILIRRLGSICKSSEHSGMRRSWECVCPQHKLRRQVPGVLRGQMESGCLIFPTFWSISF